ncbi:MAG: hypothetical protein AAF668_08285 [Pseudomonadota bacterium]
MSRQGTKSGNKNKTSRVADTSLSDSIARLEERIDTIATALMGTEEFARTANFATNLQLRMQKGMAGHMARQLALFNMPSREDVAALGERVMDIDERLVRIEEMLHQIAQSVVVPAEPTFSTAKPSRNRQPKKTAMSGAHLNGAGSKPSVEDTQGSTAKPKKQKMQGKTADDKVSNGHAAKASGQKKTKRRASVPAE